MLIRIDLTRIILIKLIALGDINLAGKTCICIKIKEYVKHAAKCVPLLTETKGRKIMELDAFKKLTDAMFLLKEKIEGLDKNKKEITSELNKMKAIAMVELDKNDMKTFKVGDCALTKVDKKSVKVTDMNLFMNWLEQRGELRNSLTVSAAKATTIWNEEFEIAKENKDIDFLTKGVPGLSEPATHSLIQMRGGK